MSPDTFENVIEAFSRQSVQYDLYEEDHLILRWMRKQVRDHLVSFLKPNDMILEINAGTGMDAVFLAKKGWRVHATDISDGMLEQIKLKINSLSLNDKVTIQKCSFTELSEIKAGPFDHIFSNFGGLNCLCDLNETTKFFPSLLKEGGKVTIVIMPPVCPWEISFVLTGKFDAAFRRLKRKGTSAHIEGIYFKSYYHSVSGALKALGKNFKKKSLKGLCSFTPPPYMKNFPSRFPQTFRFLNMLDEKLSEFYPWNSFADHYILTAEYQPDKKSRMNN
jgi:ubiquinone/menaquinone biosynthesis C-methylase UbiE